MYWIYSSCSGKKSECKERYCYRSFVFGVDNCLSFVVWCFFFYFECRVCCSVSSSYEGVGENLWVLSDELLLVY